MKTEECIQTTDCSGSEKLNFLSVANFWDYAKVKISSININQSFEHVGIIPFGYSNSSYNRYPLDKFPHIRRRLCLLFKVIVTRQLSFRSVINIKIINNSGSILANIAACNEKQTSIQIETRFTRSIFCGGRINLNKLELYLIYHCFSGCCFPYALRIFETGFK